MYVTGDLYGDQYVKNLSCISEFVFLKLLFQDNQENVDNAKEEGVVVAPK